MKKWHVDSCDYIIEPEKVYKGAGELFDGEHPDQIAIIARKGDRFEIYSSHCADDLENMAYDAFDALEADDIGFDEDAE